MTTFLTGSTSAGSTSLAGFAQASSILPLLSELDFANSPFASELPVTALFPLFFFTVLRNTTNCLSTSIGSELGFNVGRYAL